METLPAENNLFLTTEGYDQNDNSHVLNMRFENVHNDLEEVCEEKESYPHTCRSGENSCTKVVQPPPVT